MILLIFSIFSSFAEVLSIGSLLPFLGVLTAPDKVFNTPYVQFIIRWLQINEPGQLILPMTIIFALSAFLSGAMRMLVLWGNNRVSYAIGADLSILVYKKTLFQPYRVHISRNSIEILTGIRKTNDIVGSFLSPLFNLVSSVFIGSSILFLLISLNPLVSSIAFIGFGLIYVLIAFITKKVLKINSEIIAKESTQVNKAIQEGLGGIRDILINGSQEYFCELYKISDQKVRKASAESFFIGGSPRYAVESLGMMLIAGLAYRISESSAGVNSILPLLGALAFGAQRMLPILQQGYHSWSMVKTSESLVVDVLELLDQPLPEYAIKTVTEPLPFTKQIEIQNISFRYQEDGPWILKNFSLTIPKGIRIGFVGVTGSGKSTLLDIIMALLIPTDGFLSVDGRLIDQDSIRMWQANIAHVPQNIYLSDNTIAENIAFGIPLDKIDNDKVRFVAEQAQIAEHIEGLKMGYDTFVGERGIRLSGGQRQRIGIARALYKDAKVIIFDEATSALDNETEKAVMEAIDSLGKDLTILMIAHRISTVKNCDKIVELKSGEIVKVGKYEELFAVNV
jgi:ATP-binding cassette subfamily B protein